MSRPHDPATTGGLRQFTFSAWTRVRNHQCDDELMPGETRPADDVLQIHGMRLRVRRGAAAASVVVIDESGQPMPILEFLDRAEREGRRVSGVLIACLED